MYKGKPKKISGKNYRLQYASSKKSKAQNNAKTQRKKFKGISARVVKQEYKGKAVYGVYTRINRKRK